MTDCEKYESLLERLIAGDPVEGREDLLRHLGECPSCRSLMEFHDWLDLTAPGLEEPDSRDLETIRGRVMEEILNEQPYRSPITPFRSRAAVPYWQRPSWLAAAAALILAAGFGIGRIALPGPASEIPIAAGNAIRNGDSLRNAASSPYLFSNVTLQPMEAGQVRLGYDVTRRVEVARTRNDPMVREALVQAMLGSAQLGERLKAVDLAGGLTDPEIRSALILAMESDPSVAVRLQSLVTLSGLPAETDVQEAMLRVLRSESNVQMRLLAVDYLGTNAIRADLLREALSGTPSDGSQAVLRLASEKYGI